jgi:hypothetical protein
MSDTYEQLITSLEAYNALAIAEFVLEHDLVSYVWAQRGEFVHTGRIWLAETLAGAVRIRTLFADETGIEYADAVLAVESTYHGDRDVQGVLLDQIADGGATT